MWVVANGDSPKGKTRSQGHLPPSVKHAASWDTTEITDGPLLMRDGHHDRSGYPVTLAPTWRFPSFTPFAA